MFLSMYVDTLFAEMLLYVCWMNFDNHQIQINYIIAEVLTYVFYFQHQF